jgi:hypothetical protein
MSMFIPDAAHKERVAQAVEQAASSGDVTLVLSADEASNLHVMAVAHYRQVREELEQPLRNELLAVLQILDEATKAARANEEAQRLHNGRFIDRAARLLQEELGLSITLLQGARLLGAVQGLAPVDLPPEYAYGRLVGFLAELAGKDLAELGQAHEKYKATAERLMILFVETE